VGKRVKKQKHEAELIEPERLADDLIETETSEDIKAMRRAMEKLAGPVGDNVFSQDQKDVFRLCFINAQSVGMVCMLTGEGPHYVKQVREQVKAILKKTYLEERENV
jgi:hypothetical protein